jgi:general secretion pathway protein G
MKRGFSLVELMIVVAVLGIMAAIVVPQFQSHSIEAKIAVAKDNLRILRSAIDLYTAQHGSL